MFGPNSRYYKIQDANIIFRKEDGSENRIVYKRRRFIPLIEDTDTFLEHTVMQGERLDNITARYMSNPTLFWRICDTNMILKPDELTEEAGHVIKIALLKL